MLALEDLVGTQRFSGCEHVQVEPRLARQGHLEPDFREARAGEAAHQSLVRKRSARSEQRAIASTARGERIQYVVEHCVV